MTDRAWNLVIDFTVVICTYNGEQQLPGLLARLREQVNTADMAWQVLVIDNNSQDGTAALVRRYQHQWPGFIRYGFEPRQGLAYARRCAISQIESPWVGFLDDDTLPDLDWVSQAYKFAQRHPAAGAFGGRIDGQFEVPPPPNFQRISTYLAIIDRGDRAFQYLSRNGVLPAGAGMVIRTAVWRKFVAERPVLAGVCGKSLSSKGEDVETLSYIRQSGHSIWYVPALHLTHQIPKERLTYGYLKRLLWGIGLSRYPLRMLKYRPWQRPGMTLIYWLNDSRKLITYGLAHWRLLHQQDGVIQAEWGLHLASLVSPLHFWKAQW